MDPRRRYLLATIERARGTFMDNVRHVSMDEALQAAGGHRSILGITKHVAGWSAVYYSYAFDETPRHWEHTDWPRGLRHEIALTQDYFDEILGWFEQTYQRWLSSVTATADFDPPRPLHWGGTAALTDIVGMTTIHWTYHAGEINAILAAVRGEAWEYGEEVEENHISTLGRRVRPSWMSDEQATAYEQQA
jgi:hypothetical protein